ncbi:uncharacterized protein LOC107703573 isoform X1 [Sinocyclocheilus anshuiensis]|uniref:uncharacterized protein LOC107703573 isoform X1 n=1 Tax=Sinocyclocheilus anshuiensis TaxID=1608454 RepID=UPI0007BA8440|nr:PREDICTED: uncharacterized protein LOC107703573 isoform X1 [Sinocyclocheilus anshuiensis]
MKKLTVVDLTTLVKDFLQLEHKITEMKGENNTLEIELDETSRLLKIAQNKEKQLIEEAPVHSGGEKQRDRGSASEGEKAGTAEPSRINGLSSEEEKKLRLILS